MPEFELKKIFLSIEKILPALKNKIACFDADGTLWKDDVDFCFLNYQIQNQILKNKDILQKIKEAYLKDHTQACILLAQRNKGYNLEQLQKWSQDCFLKTPLHVFSFQKQILSFLKKHKTTIYVITASPQWLVEAAVNFYHLDIDFVIGIKTKINNNTLTDEVQHPVSVGAGKVDAFLRHSNKQHPFFVSGNTYSDLHILELSSHIKFAVASSQKNESHYESERKLLQLAQDRSWFYKDLLKSP